MTEFMGFTTKCLDFFTELSLNNNKTWFEEHRSEYQDHVLAPAREFVAALGEKLKKTRPGLQADPRVNKSLFRIFRDTRFSRDKTPYKTHLAVWFWEGPRPRMECPGFYFHLEPGLFRLGGGMYVFPGDVLEAYRRAATDPQSGPALVRALEKVRSSGSYVLGGKHYKKTPRGYGGAAIDPELLLHNGLYVGTDCPPREVFSESLVDFCFNHFQNMMPLHEWLSRVI
ncbi:MAG: DUF2461 domain-containing protein [Pseudomonadota bacterium]